MTTPPLDTVEPIKHEMSRFILASKINAINTTEKTFTATEEECVALAKRFDIPTVHNFKGSVQIIFLKGKKAFSISGSFKASVTQECRTTFKSVGQKISENFKEFLLLNAEDIPSPEEALESKQVMELLDGENIDYGEIATQWLALSLDPYPRAEGEVFEHIEHDPAETNPFSALKSVKLQNNDKK